MAVTRFIRWHVI